MSGPLRAYFTLSAPLWAQVKKSAAAFFILAATGFAAGLIRPEWTNALLGTFTSAAASAGLYQTEAGALMATILLNNLFSLLAAIAVGLVPFLRLPAFPLGLNALLLGGLAAYYQQSGLGLAAYLAGTLPHGLTEFAALSISCGTGLYLCEEVTGRVLGRKPNRRLDQVLSECLHTYVRLVAPLLAVSAALEAFVTPLIFARFMP